MKYLFPLMLVLFFSCKKDPKPQPNPNVPKTDTPGVAKRTFKGTYVMYDSTAYWGSTTYPPWYDTLQFQVNTTVSIEIDSVSETIISGRDTFTRENRSSTRYSRKRGSPRYWNVTQDSVTYYFWDSRSGHVQVDTYVKGYRKK